MRRGLRGLLIVLGALCVAASADALTMWNGDSSPESRFFLVDEISEDYAGVVVENPGDSTLTNRDRVLAGGDSRFGRRDFIWHPSPVIPLNYFSTGRPSRTLPGFRRRYIPIGRLPGTIGGFPGLGENDFDDGVFWSFDGLRPHRLPWRRSSQESWEILRDLVEVLPYPNSQLFAHIDRWDSTIISLPLPEQESSFGGRIEFRWDRFSFSPGDFYDAPASAAVNIALVPEPGTAALLLAGLCALAACRRRC